MLDNLIPEGLRPKLLQSPISGKILSTANELEEHFRLAGVPFFKEYTDHSFQHSIDVFRSACDILTDRAIEVMSSEDMNILLLSCILHDAGLHITEDTFLALIDPSNTRIASPSLDSKSWPELWDDFLGEAKRFNAKKLQSLFGDTQAIREPPRSSLEMTQRDRLLIGDFLRKHHPRYAHDFAKHTIIDSTGGFFKLDGLEEKTRDLAGLIARSHGLELRAVFDYIISHYDLRDYNRVHIVFLMVLLRIADYMQIQPARAPFLFGKLHKIRSPFSLGEWRVHQCISNVNAPSFDPEAISISAEPKSVHEYLRFEEWIDGFQSELDSSWAILGEVYGRFTQEALDKLQLRVRRLRSNIEDKPAFQKRVNFVPERIQFSVSEPELLKLLMEPLYGDNPLYGLRELTQNASDSVKEFDHLKETILYSVERANLIADIEVELMEEPDWCFIIRDRGTGMTLHTIRNYFLKAGASFRNSDIWKQSFLNEQGKSRIARTGRFGVGALASYLIGERIEVYSRHYTDKTGLGYRFQAKIDDDEIEITTLTGPVGTTITIWSDKKKISHVKEYLQRKRTAPFYILPNPSFKLVEATGTGSAKIPDSPEHGPVWIEATTDRYQKVIWNRTTPFAPDSLSDMGYLYCNGILVGDINKPRTDLLINRAIPTEELILRSPTVLVTDYDANLPLDLARKGLSSRDDDLVNCVKASVSEHLLSEIFLCPAQTPSEIEKWWQSKTRMIECHYWSPFIFGKTGFSLLNGALLSNLTPRYFVVQQGRPVSMNEQIADGFSDDGWFSFRRGFFGHSNSDKLGMLRDEGRHKFPSLRDKGSYARSPFSQVCYIVEAEQLELMLQLTSASNYIRAMAAGCLPIKIREIELCVLNRSSDATAIEMAANFAKRVYSTLKYQGEWNFPATIWSNLSGQKFADTSISVAWNTSFTLPYLPYDPTTRHKALRADAPILRFI